MITGSVFYLNKSKDSVWPICILATERGVGKHERFSEIAFDGLEVHLYYCNCLNHEQH